MKICKHCGKEIGLNLRAVDPAGSWPEVWTHMDTSRRVCESNGVSLFALATPGSGEIAQRLALLADRA